MRRSVKCSWGTFLTVVVDQWCCSRMHWMVIQCLGLADGCIVVCVCVVFMNICWVPHLKKSFTLAAIVLLSLLLSRPLCSSHMRLRMGDCSFAQCILNICKVVTVLFGCYMAGATWNCCCLHSHFVYTIQPSTNLQCHFIGCHIPRMYACLSVACHLHLWQNYSCRNTKAERILK